MKRYIKSSKMTTDEMQQAFNKNSEICGHMKTKRGKDYNYRIMRSGHVEVWYDYRVYDGVSRGHDKSRYLYNVPQEVQNYLNFEYGEQLADLGITLSF